MAQSLTLYKRHNNYHNYNYLFQSLKTFHNRCPLAIENEHFDRLMRSLKDSQGLTFDHKDYSKHVSADKDYFLLKYEDKFLQNKHYLNYLNSYSLSEIDGNKTFRKRENWCEVDDGKVADIFLSYMTIFYPRAVLNSIDARCINNTHRGYFKEHYTLCRKKLICLSLLTGFTRVLAELEGKIYGNKMLKMEPSFYKKLNILLPTTVDAKGVNHCFSRVNRLLRSGDSIRASIEASQFIYGSCFSQADAERYERELEKIRIKLHERRRCT